MPQSQTMTASSGANSKVTVIDIEGMTCAVCVGVVETILGRYVNGGRWYNFKGTSSREAYLGGIMMSMVFTVPDS